MLFEFVPITLNQDERISEMLAASLTRLFGSICFICIIFYLDYNVLSFRISRKALIITLPCLLIAVNNAPIIALISGSARVTENTVFVLVYAIKCLYIGLFEECAFRGVFFPLILTRTGKDAKGIFLGIILSSALFGLIHLLNLFGGAGFGATMLQIGYSFLVGGMMSFVLIKTGSIWPCVFLHAIYDFGGYLISTAGEGVLWDTPTVVITAVLTIIVAAYIIFMLFKTKEEEVNALYKLKGEKDVS